MKVGVVCKGFCTFKFLFLMSMPRIVLMFFFDCFSEKVKNQLANEAISIHFHGIYQRGTAFMDGVGKVTQCPIQPGQTFRYEFKAEPSGTFWYHAHVGSQQSDGLFGAFIVRDKPHHYTNAEEAPFIMAVQDWFREPSLVAAKAFFELGHFDGRKRGSYKSKSIDGFIWR